MNIIISCILIKNLIERILLAWDNIDTNFDHLYVKNLFTYCQISFSLIQLAHNTMLSREHIYTLQDRCPFSLFCGVILFDDTTILICLICFFLLIVWFDEMISFKQNLQHCIISESLLRDKIIFNREWNLSPRKPCHHYSLKMLWFNSLTQIITFRLHNFEWSVNQYFSFFITFWLIFLIWILNMSLEH